MPGSVKAERQRVAIELSLWENLAFLMAVQEMGSLQGRYEPWDDLCARCVFDIGVERATPTFCYIVTEETTYTIKQGKRVHVKGKVRRTFLEVHHCPRHQCEVQPAKAGPFTGGFPIGGSKWQERPEAQSVP